MHQAVPPRQWGDGAPSGAVAMSVQPQQQVAGSQQAMASYDAASHRDAATQLAAQLAAQPFLLQLGQAPSASSAGGLQLSDLVRSATGGSDSQPAGTSWIILQSQQQQHVGSLPGQQQQQQQEVLLTLPHAPQSSATVAPSANTSASSNTVTFMPSRTTWFNSGEQLLLSSGPNANITTIAEHDGFIGSWDEPVAARNGNATGGAATLGDQPGGSASQLGDRSGSGSGGGHPVPGMTASLYVKNLPNDATELFLYQRFAPYGALLSCRVHTEPTTGKCKGVGFVNFREQGAALHALQSLHGTRLPTGHKLHITLQAPRSMRSMSATTSIVNPTMGIVQPVSALFPSAAAAAAAAASASASTTSTTAGFIMATPAHMSNT